jgi:hypothetical protein
MTKTSSTAMQAIRRCPAQGLVGLRHEAGQVVAWPPIRMTAYR